MTLAALHREILVAAPPHRTFELFTGRHRQLVATGHLQRLR